MALLDHPDARALLADAVLTPEPVRGCGGRLTAFLERYLPRFHRAEQRANAALVIRGPLSGLQRKTCEPIAVGAGAHRKPVQFLVGAGKWTTRPSWPSCAVTSARSWPMTGRWS
jgi:hypothetical protein